MNSFTCTLTGNTSVLEANFFPPLELNPSREYVLGMVELSTYNSIPNIEEGCNKFYVGDETIELPTGSYEVDDIQKYLKKTKNLEFELKANNNTLKCELKCNKEINFIPDDSIGKLLGFNKRRLPPNRTHTSDVPVKILKINSLRLECNITSDAYINNKQAHTIFEFSLSVPPGYKVIASPTTIIYQRVVVKAIDHLQVKIVDQDGNLVNFRGELINIRLHIKAL